MRFYYYGETDSLYIELREDAAAESREVAEDVVIDLSAEGGIVGIDIQNASRHIDLNKLEVTALPFVHLILRTERSAPVA
jgi:uncharacterized protein YuzE